MEIYEIFNKVYLDHQENLLKGFPDDSIDLILTDPPYEMNYKSNIPGSKAWNKSGVSDSKFENIMHGDSKGIIDWQDFLSQCFRILKPNRYLFLHANMPFLLNRGTMFQDVGFTYKGTICWNKSFAIGGDLDGTMKRDWEPIIYLSKGKKAKLNPIKVLRNNKETKQEEMQERKRISEIADWDFTLKDNEKLGHMTQKPIALTEQIISLASKENELVLDPFSGSGTVLKAAQNTNRNYIGIECDSKFYEIIQKRLIVQDIFVVEE